MGRNIVCFGVVFARNTYAKLRVLLALCRCYANTLYQDDYNELTNDWSKALFYHRLIWRSGSDLSKPKCFKDLLLSSW